MKQIFEHCEYEGKAAVKDPYGVIFTPDRKTLLFVPEDLSEYTIPESVTTIGEFAFFQSNITQLHIPESVTRIGGIAFYDCLKMKSFTIPRSVKTIDHRAFMGCRHKETHYTGSLREWCEITFVCFSNPAGRSESLYINGEEIIDLVIPQGISTIKAFAFCYLKHLQSLTIPDSVTKIEPYAFHECRGLKHITCRATTPPFIEKGTIIDEKLHAICGTKEWDFDVPLFVPQGTKAAYQAAPIWGEFKNIQENV